MLDENLIQRIMDVEGEPFIEVDLSDNEVNKLRSVLESNNIYFRVLDFSKVDSKQKLMLEFEKKLEFPEYFGRNWDALKDCLCDFSWVDSSGFVFLIPHLPNLTLYETHIMMQILDDSRLIWLTVGGRKLFKIIFPLYKKYSD